ncbi:RadC family protein [Roseobacter sp. EG26]|uniref:RadC family protein n=1 Tax=Roseobacter sp. EG26 TaxID=3412477 RepID=UPI00260613FF|nr:DNA repair protein RadC [uncultured Roseobacter sp.]
MRNGFSEAALRGLEELERRIPSGVVTKPLEAGEFASAGGAPTPHYIGHRQRLRTRFLAGGHAPMPEYELLELLLFNAIERIDVKPLAKRLLSTFGDLNGVVAASKHRLLQVRGTTEKVYLQLKLAESFAQRMAQAKVLQRCALSCWDDLIEYCRTAMAHRDTEQFRILYLDTKNVVIADEEQARGTVNHVPVYPREVVKRALELNASALILVHNHPSGDPSPSQADVSMTDAIVRACEAIDARVHDHVIIGKNSESSFRSLGLLT